MLLMMQNLSILLSLLIDCRIQKLYQRNIIEYANAPFGGKVPSLIVNNQTFSDALIVYSFEWLLCFEFMPGSVTRRFCTATYLV